MFKLPAALGAGCIHIRNTNGPFLPHHLSPSQKDTSPSLKQNWSIPTQPDPPPPPPPTHHFPLCIHKTIRALLFVNMADAQSV
ncbi:hypothetical protein L2E82_45862 [Cichorium intybus]|uniref:Uncharacterized protein n=1 Tax=Cichorium intybus TaxID=13427 RepID=A0ACB8ZUP5_CICIN|nr:hypothetical protein L2E82_45862 [Cichorium intybus]